MVALLKTSIQRTSQQLSGRVYARPELLHVISDNIESWLVDESREISPDDESIIVLNSDTQTTILTALLKNTDLQSIEFPFPYRTVHRFSWGYAPTYRLLQSVDSDGYFTHYTAMQIHGLTDQIPKTIYFNVEQPATGGGGALSQEGIDRAFRGKCRVSNNVIQFRNLTVCKLNGQNTGHLGVVAATVESDDIRTTNLERTLIDATVRPIYSGGVAEVAQAFKNAAGQVSVNKLVSYLKKLNYTYPYHQAIGYYLSRAGVYKQSQIDLLKQLPIDFDFYLTYQMKNPDYNEEWRLFIPKGF
jgi:hypothetical protein